MTKSGSTRFAVKLVYIAHLALAVEPSAGVVVPLLAAIAADPLLAVADFDHRVGRLAGGADEVWLGVVSFGAPTGFSGWGRAVSRKACSGTDWARTASEGKSAVGNTKKELEKEWRRAAAGWS